MDDGTKLCELCGMHKKLNIGPAGALWLEKDGAGDAVLMVECCWPDAAGGRAGVVLPGVRAGF